MEMADAIIESKHDKLEATRTKLPSIVTKRTMLQGDEATSLSSTVKPKKSQDNKSSVSRSPMRER